MKRSRTDFSPRISFSLFLAVITDFPLVIAGFGKTQLNDSPEFYLITKGDSLTYTLLHDNVSTSPGWLLSDEDPAHLAIILHGMGGNYNSTSNYLIAKALLDSFRKWNLIAVDYSNAINLDYLRAVNKVSPVAKKVVKLVTELINNGEVRPDKITLFGFSLGAHIAGVVGYLLRASNVTVGHIVAMDPALPSFESVSNEERLTKDDAEHVMVIHTTGGNIAFADPLGHVDFYPNGGTDPQPMCISSRLSSMKCSHSASYKYLADSIQNGGYEATKCDNWSNYEEGYCDGNPTTIMSIDIDRSAEGKYYLKTRNEPPYGEILMEDDPKQNVVDPTMASSNFLLNINSGSKSIYSLNTINIIFVISLQSWIS